MHILVLHNPFAGSYDPAILQRLGGALEARGHSVRNLDCRTFDPATASSWDLICIAGGDGTVREVVASLPADAPPVAVYPLGTINLVAREAGYPADFAHFAERATSPAAHRLHHTGSVGALRFLCCLSVGPDSEAVARLSAPLKRRIGRLAYAVAAMRLLLRWPHPALVVTIDGGQWSCEAAYVFKGRYFAGPWTLAPRASLCEPGFEVLLIPRMRRRDFFRLCLYGLTGGRFADPQWIRRHGHDIEIGCDVSAPVQADGDIVGCLPVRIGPAAAVRMA
jgi:diacylglycerol kinase family enzyme